MRVHILCPGDHLDGSVESLHQFGRIAATIGYDTRIAYFPAARGVAVEEFRSYGLRPDQVVPDDSTLLLLTDHVHAEQLEEFAYAEKLLWWLRLDETDAAAIERALALPGAIHLAGSEYARQFLHSRGVSARLVGDYIHSGYRQLADARAAAGKLDVVLYNPDDPSGFVARLIETSQQVLRWIPVEGVGRTEVAELFANAKVYVDFGAHRGRTRLFREAVTAKCAVIVGSSGAAGNDVDTPVPDGYRFDATDRSEANLMAVLNRIAYSLQEFRSVQIELMDCYDEIRDAETIARKRLGELLAQLNETVDPDSMLQLPSARRLVNR